jgi:hypothetical protein
MKWKTFIGGEPPSARIQTTTHPIGCVHRQMTKLDPGEEYFRIPSHRDGLEVYLGDLAPAFVSPISKVV